MSMNCSKNYSTICYTKSHKAINNVGGWNVRCADENGILFLILNGLENTYS